MVCFHKAVTNSIQSFPTEPEKRIFMKLFSFFSQYAPEIVELFPVHFL